MKIKRILLNNIGLKLLALLLAFVTWFYIGELSEIGSEKKVLQRLLSSPYFISKKLYIRPVFFGKVPAGYTLVNKDVKITPEFIIVMGPTKTLASKECIYTKPININEYTKSKTIEIGLERISYLIGFQDTRVQVYLALQKKKDNK